MKTALVVLGALAAHAPGHADFDAEEVMARSYAAYAALTSYADSGTVTDESAGFKDRHTFRTYFTREPRNLFLEFRFVGSQYDSGIEIDADNRTVLWMQNGELQTWDSRTQAHETYPENGGRQVDAIKGATYATKGISVLVPSLLYTKAGLASVIQATEEPVAAGTEMIGGRRCLKVTGIERWRYPSGQVTGVRPITLWVDAETYLIRKILEDTPQNFARGSISRRIVTFDPHANPPLQANHFSYKVPEP